jgi:hypothetical protein
MKSAASLASFVCTPPLDVDCSPYLFSADYTTHQYFECKRESRFPNAQANVTATCLRYLSFDIFRRGYCGDDQELESLLEDNALLNYTAQHWGHHARRQADETCKGLVLEFLRDHRKVACASQVLLVHAIFRYPKYSQSCRKDFSGMHLSSFFGLQQIINSQLENGDEPDLKDSDGRTPLSWAAGNGHDGVVRLLAVRDNVEVNSKDNNGLTPLLWAAGHGHEAVVRLLVARDDVDVNMRNSNGRTPTVMGSWKGASDDG